MEEKHTEEDLGATAGGTGTDKRCPRCGTPLAQGTVDFEHTPGVTESLDEERAEFEPGEMTKVAYCPNPDCPGPEEGPDVGARR